MNNKPHKPSKKYIAGEMTASTLLLTGAFSIVIKALSYNNPFLVVLMVAIASLFINTGYRWLLEAYGELKGVEFKE